MSNYKNDFNEIANRSQTSLKEIEIQLIKLSNCLPLCRRGSRQWCPPSPRPKRRQRSAWRRPTPAQCRTSCSPAGKAWERTNWWRRVEFAARRALLNCTGIRLQCRCTLLTDVETPPSAGTRTCSIDWSGREWRPTQMAWWRRGWNTSSTLCVCDP